MEQVDEQIRKQEAVDRASSLIRSFTEDGHDKIIAQDGTDTIFAFINADS